MEKNPVIYYENQISPQNVNHHRACKYTDLSNAIYSGDYHNRKYPQRASKTYTELPEGKEKELDPRHVP